MRRRSRHQHAHRAPRERGAGGCVGLVCFVSVRFLRVLCSPRVFSAFRRVVWRVVAAVVLAGGYVVCAGSLAFSVTVFSLCAVVTLGKAHSEIQQGESLMQVSGITLWDYFIFGTTGKTNIIGLIN